MLTYVAVICKRFPSASNTALYHKRLTLTDEHGVIGVMICLVATGPEKLADNKELHFIPEYS